VKKANSTHAQAIIEDDASFRRAVERLLRAIGFEAQIFASAEEFLGSAAPGSHACLILDIHPPGMSAFELLCLKNQNGWISCFVGKREFRNRNWVWLGLEPRTNALKGR